MTTSNIPTAFKTKKAAEPVIHSLGNPSKMPGKSYGLPAAECKVGSKLRNVPGSTCADCYAHKGRYAFDNVQRAQYARLATIDSPQWTMAMVKMLQGEKWFRWHDSGDLQSVSHLAKICMVAVMTPDVNHWLPTREVGLVRRYLKDGGIIPANLNIRVSAAMVDGDPIEIEGCTTSTVHHKAKAKGHKCPAPTQNNECATCRACWNKSVDNVSYHIH